MGKKSKMASKIRLNFHSDSEAMINKQINLELFASYTYMAMACYFDRDDVALHGFAKKYRADSEEEREHAMKLVEYQNKRGGRVVFQDVAKPERQEWDTALQAVEQTLEMERTVHRHLLELQKTDFIEGEYLKEQVEAEKELGDLITKMKRAGD